MKCIKLLFCVVLSVSIILSVFIGSAVSVNAASGTTGSCYWSYSSGKLTISGSGAMGEYSSSLTTPWYKYKDSITTVVVKSGVTEICAHFVSSYPKLRSVTIPKTVTYIGSYAFEDCSTLSKITMTPNNNIYVCGNPFENTAFSNNSSNWSGKALYIKNLLLDTKSYATGTFKIKDGTTVIADYAFCDSKVSKVIIPHGVKSISASTFCRAYNLSEVDFTNSIKEIRRWAFYYNDNLTKITFHGTIQQFAKIDVGYNNQNYESAYMVESPVTIKLKKTSATLKVKKSTKIKATVKNSNYSTKYKSLNKKIATVNSKGKVVAKRKGSTKIKVTNCGVTKYFKVKVK